MVSPMFEANIDNMNSDLKTLMKDAQALFTEAAAASGTRADELHAQGMTLLESAIQDAHHFQQAAVAKGKKIADDTDAYVHEYPWHAIGISAALGALIGMLISRR